MPLQQGFDTPAAKGAFYTAEGLRFMYRDPLAYLHLLYRKFRLFWNAFEIPVSADLRYYETHFPLYRLFLLNFGLVVPFALVGILWHWRWTSAYTLPLLFILAYLSTGLLFSVCARYRLPALPFLLVFAAAGIWRLKELLTTPGRSTPRRLSAAPNSGLRPSAHWGGAPAGGSLALSLAAGPYSIAQQAL